MAITNSETAVLQAQRQPFEPERTLATERFDEITEIRIHHPEVIEREAKQHRMGERAHVFDGLPYAVYLPAGSGAQLRAETECEIAECRVPSTARLKPQLITPADVKSSLRGGGNASRQIVDVMPPDFPADKLMVVEVYTPSGNWSSYSPHKHDVHNPPTEVDLDEIYYYRIDRPGGYAHQRLYTRNGKRDLTLTVRDGDAVLVRDGYHPVVAGHGYNIYYLNCLAGSARFSLRQRRILITVKYVLRGIKSTCASRWYEGMESDMES